MIHFDIGSQSFLIVLINIGAYNSQMLPDIMSCLSHFVHMISKTVKLLLLCFYTLICVFQRLLQLRSFF